MSMTGPNAGGDAQFCAEQASADTWVVTVIGEVDMTNRDHFKSAVEQALSGGPAKLIFDLAGVRFMDSSGLAVLLLAVNRAASVEVRAASSAVRRLIQVSGLVGILPIVQ